MSLLRRATSDRNSLTMGRGRARLAMIASAATIAGFAVYVPATSAYAAAVLSAITYDQCANGAPGTSPLTACNGGWINGSLNSSNSQYSEGDVVPQQLIATVGAPAGTYTLTLAYDDLKGGVHAYDSLATWNTTETTANPCQGVTGTCPATSGPASTLAIPPDPTVVGTCTPSGCSAATSAHQLAGQELVMYGATLVSISAYSHMAPTGPTDSTTVTITYTTSVANAEIELLYGAHLAASSGTLGWGTGLGAANVPGGPYHTSLAMDNGSSIGGRDNNIQASALVPVAPPAFSITKSANPTVASPGQQVTYTITVTNTGGTAGSASFTDANDTADTNVAFQSPTSPSGGTCTPDPSNAATLDCTTSSLAPGASQTFTITADMPASFTGTGGGSGCTSTQFPVTDTATITGTTTQATATVCVNTASNLVFSKSASPASTTPGGTVKYTITVTNQGSSPGSASFTDTSVPAPQSIGAVTVSGGTGGCTETGVTINCTTGTINPGATETFSYSAVMPASFTSGGGTGGCSGSNNFPVVNTVVPTSGNTTSSTVCVTANPNLVFAKSANPTSTTPGGTVNYTITVNNQGTAPGSASFSDTSAPAPQSISAVTVAGGTGSCTETGVTINCSTGTINPGATETFSYSAVMPASFSSGGGTGGCSGSNNFPVVNNVVPTSGNSTSSTVCVMAGPNLVFAKSANPTSTTPGGTVNYTITVNNQGTAPGSASFTDTATPAPQSISAVTVTGGTGSCTESGVTINCSTGTLSVGQMETFSYSAVMPASFTTGGGTGGCSGSNNFPVVNNVVPTSGNSTSSTVCVTANPNLVFAKSASPASTTPGGTVNYTITVVNTGSGPGSASFSDTSVPAPQSISAVTVTGGTGSCTESGVTINCTTGTINSGATETFSYSAVMPSSFSTGGGTGGCSGSNNFPVVNTVVPTSGNSTSSTVCVTANPNLVFAKSANPTTSTPGGTVDYTITVNNQGSGPGSASFTDTSTPAPQSISAVTVTGGTGSCTESGVTISCNTGTINPGATETFSYSAVMPASFSSGGGTGGCSGSNNFPVVNNVVPTSGNSTSSTVCVMAGPNLVFAKSASPTTSTPGGTVNYTITVANQGTGPGSATFTDTSTPAPQSISAVTVTGGTGSCSESGVTINCSTGTINPGATETFSYSAVMPASFSSGGGTGGCSGSNNFPVVNNVVPTSGNSTSSTVCVTANPNLVFAKAANPTTSTPGGTVNYTITVANQGTGPGSTSFTDTSTPAPQSISAVTVTGGTGSCSESGVTITCSTGTINPGSAEIFTYSAVMPATFTTGGGTGGCSGPNNFPVVNNVVPTSGNSTSSTVCVTANPNLVFAKSANPASSTPGGTVNYTITVANQGTGPGSATFTDTSVPVPQSISAVTVTGGTGSCSESGVTINCSTGTINPGATETFSYSAVMPSSFSSGGGTDGCSGSNNFPVVNNVVPTSGNSTSSTVCVTANPNLVFAKSANPTTSTPGGTVTYTITVANQGSGPGSASFTDTSTPAPQSISAVTVTGGTGSCTESGVTITCATGTINPGSAEIFTYSAVMPASFSTGGGTGGCSGSNNFPVVNNVIPTSGNSTSSTVCVTANPKLVFAKAANPTTSTPGGTVNYTITVANQGAAPGSTSFSDTSTPTPQSISAVTVSGGTGSCTETGVTINCTTGTINPGSAEIFTYSAVMPASFTSGGGTGGCTGPNNFPVVNTVTPGSGSSTSTTVCVAASPNLTLSKTAQVTTSGGTPVSPATTGDYIVYTISYANNGAAPATGVVIADTVPAGTEFISCTGACTTTGSPPTSESWSIGTLNPNTSGSVTVTVEITTTTACSISNTADISSPNFTPPNGVAGGPLGATVGVAVTPAPNPAGAHSSGSALGALANLVNLIGAEVPAPPTSSSQTGIGDSPASNTVATASISGVLTAKVVTTTNNAEVVGGQDPVSTDRATSEVAGLCVLPIAGICTISSATIVSNAQTAATATDASVSAAGTTTEGLVVNGVALADVAPNTCIDLPALLFGAGSFVGINVQSASPTGLPSTCAGGAAPSAGLGTVNGASAYVANLTVTAIDLHVTGILGLAPVDIVVAQATAHSDFPALTVCGPAGAAQSVSGRAFIATEDTTPEIAPAQVGYVDIPPSGGSNNQTLATVALGSLLGAGAASSATTGTITPTTSVDDSYASIADVCILPNGVKGPPSAKTCTIFAAVAKSVSYSAATATGAKSADNDTGGPNIFGATQFTSLSIAGAAITLPVTRNESLLPAGLPIEIILNQQTCDNGSSTSTGTCGGTGQVHSGLTVTAIDVIILGPTNGLPIGAEIKVAQAHSDATFG